MKLKCDIIVVLLELQVTVEDLLRKSKKLESEAALSSDPTRLPADPEFIRLVLKELFLLMLSLHDAQNCSQGYKKNWTCAETAKNKWNVSS